MGTNSKIESKKKYLDVEWGVAFIIVAFSISFIFNYWPVHHLVINPLEDHYQFGDRLRSDNGVHYRSFLSAEPMVIVIGLLIYSIIGYIITKITNKFRDRRNKKGKR